jgi:hypothetical protein
MPNRSENATELGGRNSRFVYRHVFAEEKKEAAQVVDDFLKAATKRG